MRELTGSSVRLCPTVKPGCRWSWVRAVPPRSGRVLGVSVWGSLNGHLPGLLPEGRHLW